MKQENLLLGVISDKIIQCDNQNIITSTMFLNMNQRAEVAAFCRKQKSAKCEFYGGYEDAERITVVFLPYYIDAADNIVEYFAENEGDSPVALVKASTPKGSRNLTHRDYLGSLLALGIKREVIGDIIISETGAQIFIMREMADFLLLNYDKAGRTSLKLERKALQDFEFTEAHTEQVAATVPSLRLDSVVASAFSLSRTKAADNIRGGIVFVNNLESIKPDRVLREKDKIALRGRGKIIIEEIGSRTRKDRIHVTFRKYL